MKSTEVYKVISNHIHYKLKAIGFKKTNGGMLGFYKKLKEYYLVFWFQCSRDGFDEYAGSKFVIHFQISRSNETASGSIFNRRIPYYLTNDELETILKTENEIKDGLPTPPKSYFIFSMKDDMIDWYLKKFQKKTTPYSNSSDIWFIYFKETDVEKWLKIFDPIIFRIINEYEKSDY